MTNTAEKVEYLLIQIERFSQDFGEWQRELHARSDEIHYAVGRLCEDDAFVEAVRQRLSAQRTSGSLSLSRFDIDDLPELLDLFFRSLVVSLEIARGKMPVSLTYDAPPIIGK